MKRAVTLLFFIGLSSFALAQEGSITIEQDEKITDLLRLYKSANKSSDFYQIQVFFGAYDEAQNIKSKVETDFPGWYSQIKFESPSYRVRVGRFTTKLEGERKLIEVRQKYPSAMLLKPEKKTKKTKKTK
ncbi:SPOR domain-containing protein [Flavobacteriaceae bacterium 3-367]|uniref:SPOR domain-containing protein n=1 Tax=Eudoraea algarum TaxID=3417568 RepID=UPI00326A71B8